MTLWSDIFKIHWDYLGIEENLQKLEIRKNLEVLLKEFLCMVPHDRKFFLPETKHVLRKSVMQLEGFSAYRASIGFDAISKYANNLLTKPWRKEYKTIKMYSGYYQHEIEANLLDAERMFEAMGYTKLPNDTLVLKGPICQDQVANVSRDALAAYAECQIMKEVCLGLIQLKYSSSWSVIYNFREKYTGDESHAINAIAFLISDRQHRDKLENGYSAVPPNGCSSCNVHRHQQKPNTSSYHQSAFMPSCSLHHSNNPQPLPPNMYANGPLNYGYAGLPQPPPPPILAQSHSHHHPTTIPHSKSLEHYVDYNGGPAVHNHNRHSSFDQPTYDYNRHHAYDAIDAYNSCPQQQQLCSHAAYNVSGNRYPIPANISNQFIAATSSGQYQSNNVPCNGASVYGTVVPSNAMQSHWHSGTDPAIDYSDQCYTNYNNCAPAPSNYSKRSVDHYNSYDNPHRSNVRVDHLIDVDDQQRNMQPTTLYAYNNHNLIDHEQIVYDATPSNIRKQTQSTASSAVPDSNQTSKTIHSSRNRADMSTYAQAVKMSSQAAVLPPPVHVSAASITTQTSISKHRDLYNMTHIPGAMNKSDDNSPYYTSSLDPMKHTKYTRNAKLLAEYDDLPNTNGSRNSRASDFDSFEDGGDYSNADIQRSAQNMANKNHDGVGSFEMWNFVYRKLEKDGYNKDLGERGDLSVQGLDLNPPGITTGNNTGEKKLARAQEHVNNKMLTTSVVKVKNGDVPRQQMEHHRENVRLSNKAPMPTPTNSVSSRQNGDELVDLAKSSRKVDRTTDRTEKTRSMGTLRKLKDSSTKLNKTRSSSNGGIGGAESKPVTSTNTIEWSCKFCTFLNPGSIRICSMCAKSKDFNDTTSKATTTCV